MMYKKYSSFIFSELLLTAISFVLSPWAVDNPVAHVSSGHTFSFAAMDGAAAAHAAVQLVRLISAIDVTVTAPVRRDTTSHIALETVRAN